ncbi:MAG TPA: FlgD immunoglobulin-like domain containing protein [archaeon]|nr:FlgD immunoglobulin-like domain containing protein [archaeon]
MKKSVLISLFALVLLSSQALSNNVLLFPRQKVLAELFTSADCPACFYANKYLDEVLLPDLASFNNFVIIRYHINNANLPYPQIRIKYYRFLYYPVLYLNGVEEINPEYLNPIKVLEAAKDSTTLFLDIQGSSPDCNGVTKIKATVKASLQVVPCVYNYFLVLTESNIDPAKLVPPYNPTNGQKIFNQSMRLMITGESGTPFTIKPGDSLLFENEFIMDRSWKTDNCEITAFVQNLVTRQVLQANSLMLSELPLSDLPPTILAEKGLDKYIIYDRDVLSVKIITEDPDPCDIVKVTFSSWYSADGTSYQQYSPGNVLLRDSIFIFAPESGQQGNYRFVLIGKDLFGLSDTLEFSVTVNERAQPGVKSCDFTGDGRASITDVIAFLILMRNNPADPRLDWNGDGNFTLGDALALLIDIMSGNCSIEAPALASASDDSYRFRPLTLNQAETEYLERIIGLMGASPEQEQSLRRALYEISGQSALPRAYSLSQNRPNPFNPATTISFTVPDGSGGGHVSIKVFDIRGRPVKTLVEGIREPGTHTIFWDGTDEAGRKLPSGTYLYRMQAGSFVAVRKMVLLK